MAEAQNVKASESLDKKEDKKVKNGNESINDSGIEMNEEKVEKNLSLKCPWVLGQLAWARGSNYPFWPCVVTLDPTSMLFFKVQNKGRSQSLVVHVQYFGDGGRHNWVLSHYMMPFSGLDDFQTRSKEITSEIKKKDPKYAAAFNRKLGVKKQWGIGVTEASGLMHLSNEERASIFEPILPPVQTTPVTNNKLKRKLSSRGSKHSSDTPSTSPKKLKQIENGDQTPNLSTSGEGSEVSNLNADSLSNATISMQEKELSEESTTPSRRKSTRNQNKTLSETVGTPKRHGKNSKETVDKPKRKNMRKKAVKLSEEEKIRRDKIDFEDYYNLNKELWKADHPDATEGEIKILLQEVWNEMNAEEKKNNLNRKFDEYRYNSADNQKTERVQQIILPQEKENSKNTENAQHENNKNTSKLNGKTVEESGKNSAGNEKNSEPTKIKSTPQKEKNKDNDQENATLQKEKSNIVAETNGDAKNDKKEESPKTNATSRNEKNKEKNSPSDINKSATKKDVQANEADEENKTKIKGKEAEKA